jgi:hypothetical protein
VSTMGMFQQLGMRGQVEVLQLVRWENYLTVR